MGSLSHYCTTEQTNSLLKSMDFCSLIICLLTVPHPPINVSLEMSGSLVAGSEYNLTCVVTKLYSGLTRSPGVRWRAHENNYFYATVPYNSTTENVSIATARFYPIYTSHSRIYICEGSLESPLLETPVLITVEPFIFFQSESLFIIVSMTRLLFIIPCA